MPTPDLIRHGFEEHLRLLQAGTAEDLTDLFAEDGVIEDPAKPESKIGKAAIRSHFDVAKQFEMTELLAIRVVANSCAAFFQVTTKTPDATFDGTPIDIFSFDETGKITSMRAYWGEHDVTNL